MGKKQTTFHMGDEFNGYGSVRYLKGTKPGHHEPVSQEHVRLSLKPGNYILKVLGSIPVYAGSPNMGPGVGLMLGAVAAVSQVSVRKDPKTGEMDVQFYLSNRSKIMDGSFSCSYGTVDRKSLEGLGVVR